MEEAFLKLSGFEQVLWGFALIATSIFLVQTLLTLIGMDGSDGLEADFDGDLELEEGEGGIFQLFTWRNLVSFFTMFGWAGIAALDHGASNLVAGIVGFVSGIAMAILNSLLFIGLAKLETNPTHKSSNAIGSIGSVYLSIPEKGKGKVTVNVQGSLKTLDATTLGPDLKTGTRVKVVSTEGDGLVVEQA